MIAPFAPFQVDSAVIFMVIEMNIADGLVPPSIMLGLVSEDAEYHYTVKLPQSGVQVQFPNGATKTDLIVDRVIEKMEFPAFGVFSWEIYLNGELQDFETPLYFLKGDPSSPFPFAGQGID